MEIITDLCFKVLPNVKILSIDENTITVDLGEDVNMPNYPWAVVSEKVTSGGHVEGLCCMTLGAFAHAEGIFCEATGVCSHAEGHSTTASGESSHAEGENTTASGESSHAEGHSTTASGESSHAEGENTTASGSISHAEGLDTTASGIYSHAEGFGTTASGVGSHSEGNATIASGICSHAEGIGTTASGVGSHAAGFYTIAQGYTQTAIGVANITQGDSAAYLPTTTDLLFIVGNGTMNMDTREVIRSNALTLDYAGNLWIAGSQTVTQFKLSALNTAPASATDTGVVGEIRVTADYIYVCVAENTWKRTALTTW